MKSLRAQLLSGVTLGTCGVLIVSGLLLYASIRRTLWSEFDEALITKARSLAAMTDQDEEGLGFDPSEEPLPEFAVSEYYQLWLTDGTVFARSPSLKRHDLTPTAGTLETPTLQTIELPGRGPGRSAGMSFVVRQEFDHAPPDSIPPPITVTLVVARELHALFSTLAHLRRVLIAVGAVSVALAAAVMAWIVRRGVKPIHHLTMQISNLGENDLSDRLRVERIPTELLPVVDRLNDLLARLNAAFQRERRFTGDVAHELRTPLAGLRSKLELALSRDRAPDEYRKAMADGLKISLQMQRMVENLLHLARADAGQLEIREESVALEALVRECWQPLEERAKARGLSVCWDLKARGTLQTDPDKLRLIIQNILDNAVVYANDNGQVEVSAWSKNGAAFLQVRNTGSALEPADVQYVFERFWRGSSSLERASGDHCGLGLPPCKAVIEQLKGSIAADAGTTGLFTVTIQLPSAPQSTM